MEITDADRAALACPPQVRRVCVAATQFRCSTDAATNLDTAEALVRDAARKGAQIILLQELFATLYFCKDEREDLFDLAAPASTDPAVNPVLARFSALAKELQVVLPISFFERAGRAHYNSIAVFDADGSCVGLYRKSHIPTGPGYEEKFFFNPGDTGFKVFKTRFANIGVAICWDQWFPECARAMALQGAEVLFYPTAIGSEPQDATLDSRDHWQTVMRGHAAANLMPVVASNRWGTEKARSCSLTFYGRSFIAGPTGAVLQQAGEFRAGDAGNTNINGTILHTFDLASIRRQRSGWGLFRDRRPDLYGPLTQLAPESPASTEARLMGVSCASGCSANPSNRGAVCRGGCRAETGKCAGSRSTAGAAASAIRSRL